MEVLFRLEDSPIWLMSCQRNEDASEWVEITILNSEVLVPTLRLCNNSIFRMECLVGQV